MTCASSSDASGSPPECYLQSSRYAFRTRGESEVTNRYDRGYVSTYDHVRDASVDMNPHWPVLVDEDLL